ncbi:Rz-like spanin [Burkholderia phage BcepB1A]|uniref:Rz-like spanin n=1 Tax=Burkholderia phage BcepB1A TaxID=279530 RepID=UPI00003779B8|nr:Rz-like spanin [Burkholderia phage BcepB1A]AAT37765.1 gp01 Rz [Burkholderia phage BcepB1A]
MPDGLKTGIELGVLALVAAGLVAIGAYVTHSIDAKKLAQVQATYATQESDRNKQLLSDYATAVQQRDKLQRDADAAADVAAKNLKDAQNETNRLQACVNSGSGCGLRVRVVTVATGSNASGATVPATVAVDSSGFARLDSTAGSAYFALRRGIDEVTAQLQACKGYAATMVKK